MKYTKKSSRFLVLVVESSKINLPCVPVSNGILVSDTIQKVSFRGVECEMLDTYFDCTDNTAYCSLRELDSKVKLLVPPNLLALLSTSSQLPGAVFI